MSYIKVIIKQGTQETQTAFEFDEFQKYVEKDIYDRFNNDKSFIENFNELAPKANGYSIEATGMSETLTTVNDITMDRLSVAQYAINCYKQPKQVLDNISNEIYKHKYIFNGRKLELNNEDIIKQEKNNLRYFYKDLSKKSAEYTSEKVKEYQEFFEIQKQQKKR